MSGSTYLSIPAIQIPLPETPLPSRAPSPEPMPHINPPQPAHVSNFTCMLSFVGQHQAQFQEQVIQTLTTLTSPHDLTSESSTSHGNSVKLHNPQVLNDRHEEVVPLLSEVQ